MGKIKLTRPLESGSLRDAAPVAKHSI